MKRVNSILFHPTYQVNFQEIQRLEKNRKFCGHTMEHFLSVARLSYLEVLTKGLTIDKEVIYAAALLHDIGRALEITQGMPHQEGSAIIAREILPECGFNEEEQATIIDVIIKHREEQEGDLATIFYLADKLSRNCFDCPVRGECNWPDAKKNMRILL